MSPLPFARLRPFALLVALLVALLGLLTAAACDDGGGSADGRSGGAPPPPPARPRVALVMKTLTNPFFAEMERGARVAEAELGIELVVRTAAQETSIEQQVGIVENLIGTVDAIVIAPGDSVRLIPVLKKARDAGMPVVNVDNRLDAGFAKEIGLTGVPFIGVDNQRGAYLAVKALVGAPDTQVEAAVIEGIRSAANAEERRRGAMTAFAEAPQVAVVASETANWKIDEAYDVAGRIMAEHPNVRLLFCANDMMALGAARYLADTGRSEVRVAGYDALAEARQALTEGRMVATVNQKADRQGYLGVTTAVKWLRGGSVPPETIIEVEVVTGHAPRPR